MGAGDLQNLNADKIRGFFGNLPGKTSFTPEAGWYMKTSSAPGGPGSMEYFDPGKMRPDMGYRFNPYGTNGFSMQAPEQVGAFTGNLPVETDKITQPAPTYYYSPAGDVMFGQQSPNTQAAQVSNVPVTQNYNSPLFSSVYNPSNYNPGVTALANFFRRFGGGGGF